MRYCEEDNRVLAGIEGHCGERVVIVLEVVRDEERHAAVNDRTVDLESHRAVAHWRQKAIPSSYQIPT